MVQDTVVDHEATDVRRRICPCAEIIGQESGNMLLRHQDDSEKMESSSKTEIGTPRCRQKEDCSYK